VSALEKLLAAAKALRDCRDGTGLACAQAIIDAARDPALDELPQVYLAGMRIVADRDMPGDELRLVNDAGVIVARVKLLPPAEPT